MYDAVRKSTIVSRRRFRCRVSRPASDPSNVPW
jgi:hypothetical protein